ncbi:MAG: hypothetical protein KAY37_09575 [Phycisphaerae bacterium]|nr:hypothetical protein [Phycisphaerae bacterium]
MRRIATTTLGVGVIVLGLVVPAAAQISDEQIKALQKRAEQENWTFTIGASEATQYPLEHLCGLVVPPPGWGEHVRWDPCLPDGRDLPAVFDWREEDPFGGVTQIRSQANCGSCWAFGAVAAMESAILLTIHEPIDLSEQWLVSCSDAGSCDGGWHFEALEAMTCTGTEYGDPCGDYGAVLEEDFPYNATNSACYCPYDHPHCLEAWYAVGGDEWSQPTDEQIKQAIYDHGPVATCVYVNYLFQVYDGGIFNACQDEWVNHVVLIVGWDDNEGVWIIKNSWGGTWGELGYMRITYGCSRIGFSTCYVVYPEPISDCNNNGVADEDDITGGFSNDCDTNGVPDECEWDPNPPLAAQSPQEAFVPAQDFSDAGYPSYSIKQWDDFTVDEDVFLGPGHASFRPVTWTGFGEVDFLVEIADAPGGAEAGSNVLLTTLGSGADGLVSWDFDSAVLPAGTYWFSVQATGGFLESGMVYWYRSNRILTNGSEHYYHNPGGGRGHGTDPAPGSTWWDEPADLAYTQYIIKNPDCNNNGILDECEIADGTCPDADGNGIPDECDTPATCFGDSNCDGGISWHDVGYFIAALYDGAAAWEAEFDDRTPTCPFMNNDVNGDGDINWRDIDALVEVMNTTCPER